MLYGMSEKGCDPHKIQCNHSQQSYFSGNVAANRFVGADTTVCQAGCRLLVTARQDVGGPIVSILSRGTKVNRTCGEQKILYI